MSLRELYGWLNYYTYEPFGTEVDDKRHSIMMITLHNIYRASISNKIDNLDIKDLKVSSMREELEKTKKKLYTDLSRPWKDTQKSQEQLVKEGQMMLKQYSAQYGVPIT